MLNIIGVFISGFQVQATHTYVGEDVDELSFEPGEIITVVPYENPDEQVEEKSFLL